MPINPPSETEQEFRDGQAADLTKFESDQSDALTQYDADALTARNKFVSDQNDALTLFESDQAAALAAFIAGGLAPPPTSTQEFTADQASESGLFASGSPTPAAAAQFAADEADELSLFDAEQNPVVQPVVPPVAAPPAQTSAQSVRSEKSAFAVDPPVERSPSTGAESLMD